MTEQSRESLWRNTKDELPEEQKMILAKFHRYADGKVDYWACKRCGDCLSIPGMGRFVVSRDCEIRWIYISEIEHMLDVDGVMHQNEFDEFDDEFYAKYENKELAAEHEKEMKKRRGRLKRCRDESVQD